MTKEERHLWYDFLKNLPVTFHRQKVFGQYIFDFYCASAGIAIEVDGSQYFSEEGEQKDGRRSKSAAEHKNSLPPRGKVSCAERRKTNEGNGGTQLAFCLVFGGKCFS